MANESVAVLDIRSYEVTFLIGSKGVNDTFVFYGSRSEPYEGYSSDGFFDGESFRRAVIAAVTSVRQNYEGEIGEVFVGVPAAFVSVKSKGHTISFPSKRKISSQEVDALYESGFNELLKEGKCIRRSDMYFSLGDNRKYFGEKEIRGSSSASLQGALCYYFADEQFVNCTTAILKELSFEKIDFIPSSLAQAMYLLPQKVREGYAFLLDIGFLSSTFSVVYGNGIVREESFDLGLGYILASLMQGLNIDYEKAEEILYSANVSGGTVSKDLQWMDVSGAAYSVRQINEIVKCGFDDLCEAIEEFFAKYYRGKNAAMFQSKPICITGEGLNVSGGAEHIAGRLNRMTQVLYPDLPYYDKPVFSSRMALLNAALGENKKHGLLYRIFNAFGGKKK
ncbi:MAG: hypothetical protein IJ506_00950 [Clostridia bacterium]|nr:hypothetical protein [Clostridia bacterium]